MGKRNMFLFTVFCQVGALKKRCFKGSSAKVRGNIHVSEEALGLGFVLIDTVHSTHSQWVRHTHAEGLQSLVSKNGKATAAVMSAEFLRWEAGLRDQVFKCIPWAMCSSILGPFGCVSYRQN